MKKRRQLEVQSRLSRLGRPSLVAPLNGEPLRNKDGGSSDGAGAAPRDQQPAVQQRGKESLLILKAKALQEVGGPWDHCMRRERASPQPEGL